VRNRAASSSLLLLTVAAVFLGPAHVSRAQPGSSSTASGALKVRAYGGLARRAFPVYLSFRVQGAGAVSVKLTMRLRSSVAVSSGAKLVDPVYSTRQVRRAMVRRNVPAGRYTYCAVATDRAGHRAKSCAYYRVV
jgi:hypothetical protein